MKKISRTIAMILVLVMIAGTFTGCLSWWLITGEPLDLGNFSGKEALGLIFLPVIDVLLLPVALTVAIIRAGIEAARADRGKRFDSIDTFSAAISSLPKTESDSLIQKFDSLPESELASLTEKFYSLSESEINFYSDTINSFSEEEISAIVAAINNLSEAEIASSIEKLNSMPKRKLVFTMRDLQLVKFRHQYK